MSRSLREPSEDTGGVFRRHKVMVSNPDKLKEEAVKPTKKDKKQGKKYLANINIQ